ncbi:head GIN domain-containing protein [Actinotalea sp. C106]|uniref:head GIN domain-containing protein n=1 Tax=Actinotalea sp. C106 TaxID=2908644 RepID=UPI002027E7C2|nr:head GIN domain-containing protein [Actinotalea sp. C106]
MTLRPLPAVLTAVVGLVVLAGCGSTAAVGPRTTETREIAEVTAVELATSGDLTVEHGTSPSLTVTAGERVLPRLTSEVDDGVLRLGTERSFGWRGPGAVSYHLVVTDLEAVELAGSGDITVDRADGETLAVSIQGSGAVRVDGVDVQGAAVSVAGSGDVVLGGRAAELQVSIEGSGAYEGEGLTSRDAAVSIAGSGDVDVEATRTLDVSIAGSGSVTHGGGARVTSDIQGSGDLRVR